MGKLFGGLGVLAVAAFAVAMFFSGAAPADEHGWASLPAEMDGVLHIDMRSLTATPLFAELLKREDTTRPSSPTWDEVAERTGFDPLTDFHSLTIGGIGDAAEPAGTVYGILRGRFDRERWYHFLGEKAAIAREVVDDRETWSIEQERDNGPMLTRLAWFDDETAVIGSAEHFDGLLASLAGKGPRVEGTSLGKKFASLDGQLRFVALVPADLREELARESAGNPASAMLKPIDTMLLDLEIDTGIDFELAATTETEADAKKLFDTLNGYLAMGKMFAAQQPDAAEALEALQLQHDRTRVSLSLVLTGEQIWSAVDGAKYGPPSFAPGG